MKTVTIISLVIIALCLSTLLLSTIDAAGSKSGPDLGKYNKRVGQKYLDENGVKEGVQTTSSGLQYKITKRGTSSLHPKKTDTVKVHYAGTTIDGKEFDSSYSRGTPAEFGVSQVIAGWTEGLQLMSPGDEFMFYIPGDLAYGARGSPPKIGPNSVLIFKVELISIVGKADL